MVVVRLLLRGHDRCEPGESMEQCAGVRTGWSKLRE